MAFGVVIYLFIQTATIDESDQKLGMKHIVIPLSAMAACYVATAVAFSVEVCSRRSKRVGPV